MVATYFLLCIGQLTYFRGTVQLNSNSSTYMKPSRPASLKMLSSSTFCHSVLRAISLKVIPWYFGIAHIIYLN